MEVVKNEISHQLLILANLISLLFSHIEDNCWRCQRNIFYYENLVRDLREETQLEPFYLRGKYIQRRIRNVCENIELEHVSKEKEYDILMKDIRKNCYQIILKLSSNV